MKGLYATEFGLKQIENQCDLKTECKENEK